MPEMHFRLPGMACFQHDMAQGDFKDRLTRTASDSVLRDKAFKIAVVPNYDGYQCGLASMIDKFFNKRFGVLVLTQGLELFLRINNQPGNYTSPSLENFRRKVYSSR